MQIRNTIDSSCEVYNFNNGRDICDRLAKSQYLAVMKKCNLSSYAVVEFFNAIQKGNLYALIEQFKLLTTHQKQGLLNFFIDYNDFHLGFIDVFCKWGYPINIAIYFEQGDIVAFLENEKNLLNKDIAETNDILSELSVINVRFEETFSTAKSPRIFTPLVNRVITEYSPLIIQDKTLFLQSIRISTLRTSGRWKVSKPMFIILDDNKHNLTPGMIISRENITPVMNDLIAQLDTTEKNQNINK